MPTRPLPCQTRHDPRTPPVARAPARAAQGRQVHAAARPMKPGRDIVPVLVLGGLLLLFGVIYLAFPAFNGMMRHNDCIASGRTNC